MSIKGIVTAAVIGLLVGLVEATFSTFLTVPWDAVMPVLPIAVLYVVRDRPVFAYVLCGCAGAMMDLFTPGIMTFAFGRLILIVAILDLLSRTVLTNQSFYAAVAMAAVARGVDRIWVGIMSLLTDATGIRATVAAMWPMVWRSVLWDMMLVGLAFLISSSIRRRFVIRPQTATKRYG